MSIEQVAVIASYNNTYDLIASWESSACFFSKNKLPTVFTNDDNLFKSSLNKERQQEKGESDTSAKKVLKSFPFPYIYFHTFF